MNDLLCKIEATDPRQKLQAIDSFQQLLRTSNPFKTGSVENRNKIFHGISLLVKDSNQTISIGGLDCLQSLIENNGNNFHDFVNITFEIIMMRLADSKNAIREKAQQVMISLISLLGLQPGFEKLNALVISRNFHVRENYLRIILELQKVFNDAIADLPEIAVKVALLVNDTQSSVRQLAMEVMVLLHSLIGDSLLGDLESLGIRNAQQKILIDMIKRRNGTNYNPTGSQLSSTSRSSRPVRTAPKDSNLKTLGSEPQISIGKEPLGGTIIKQISPINASSSEKTMKSQYDIQTFMSILMEGMQPTSKTQWLNSPQDYNRVFNSIITSLQNSEDWQVRLKGLQSLQNLTLNTDVDKELLLSNIRGFHELIATQISDLRSAISKEACRTVVLLAVKLGSSFAPLVDFWIPVLLKQVIVKIQVISQSADSAIRSIIASNVGGYSRIVQLFVESCASKNAILRQFAVEYLVMTTICWKLDIVEKHLNSYKTSMKAHFNDSDANVRKSCRHLFLTLSEAPSMRPGLTTWSKDLDQVVLKHLQMEKLNPSNELVEAKSIQQSTWGGNYGSQSMASMVMSTILDQLSSPASTQGGPSKSFSTSSSGVDTLIPKKEDSSFSDPKLVEEPNEFVEKEMITDCNFEVPEIDVDLAEDEEEENSRVSSTKAALTSSRRMSVLPPPSRVLSNAPKSNLDSAVGGNGNRRLSHFPLPSRGLVDISTEVGSTTSMSINPSTSISNSSSTSILTSSGPQRIAHPISADRGLNSAPQRSLQDGPKRVITRSMSQNSNQYDNSSIPTSSTLISSSTNGVSSSLSGFGSILNKNKETESAESTNNAGHTVSLEGLKELAAHPIWSSRLRAIEFLQLRLNSQDPISLSQTEAYVDLLLSLLNDPHHKIVSESINTIRLAVERYSSFTLAKVPYVLMALFPKTLDRHQAIKDSSIHTLEVIQKNVEPGMIMASIVPKIADIPERYRPVLLQYISVLVPHCEAYFGQPQFMYPFLNRMANILSPSGSTKPTSNLIALGKRLLELVYNVTPQILCQQLSILPIQQQSRIKALLMEMVPEIDYLMVQSSKNDWNVSAQVSLPSNSPSITTVRDIASTSSIGSSNNNNNSSTPTSKSSSPSIKSSMGSPGESMEVDVPVDPPMEMERDITWLLKAFEIQSKRSEKLEALKVLKKFIKLEKYDFWQRYCSQIVSVLLEAFHPQNLSKSLSHKLTGLSPNPKGSMVSTENQEAEMLHIACKGLYLLAKHESAYLNNFLDLLTNRLCGAAMFTPVTIAIHCEEILSEMAHVQPIRIIQVLLPFVRDNISPEYSSSMPHYDAGDAENISEKFQGRLMALRVISCCVKHAKSNHLVAILPSIVEAILPCLSDPMADIRKCVIFVLVEIYKLIGDALYPYIQVMTVPQKKLLTVYIEKNLKS